MSLQRISVFLATMATVVAVGLCTASVPAQEKKADGSKTKRATFVAQYRPVGDLAVGLAKQFKDVADFQAVPDGPSNTLLLSGSPAALDEAQKTLAKLDRRPQEVIVEILILHVVSKKGADGKTDPAEVEAKDFSGSISKVVKTINALEKQGAVASMRRLQLKGVENQSAQLKELSSRPYTVGLMRSSGGGLGFGGPGKGGGGKGGGEFPAGGNPVVSRTISYKEVGTTVSLTPLVGSDGVISLHLKVNDQRGLQPEGGIPIGADENGLPVIATEFISVVVEADLQVHSGQAVLAKDVQMKSKQSGERTLIVVTAQLVQ